VLAAGRAVVVFTRDTDESQADENERAHGSVIACMNNALWRSLRLRVLPVLFAGVGVASDRDVARLTAPAISADRVDTRSPHEAHRRGGFKRSRSKPSKGSTTADRCRRRFVRFFPGGFRDDIYLAWERDYKAEAHARWNAELGRSQFRGLLSERRCDEIAMRAIRVESRTNLLFSFEKMALRDAVRADDGARAFAEGLYEFLYGRGSIETRFNQWCAVVASLPRRQTRVLTWPVVTVFGFIARPDVHMFLKPNVTRVAAAQYGFNLHYQSRPSWTTYYQVLELAATVRRDLRDLGPRDMIDIQSFLWVQGSDEYRGRTFRAAQTTRIR
jgi:hypothetical protein